MFSRDQTEQVKEPVVQKIYREWILPVSGKMQIRAWVPWATKELAIELKVQDKGMWYFCEWRVLYLRGEVQLHSQQRVSEGGRDGNRYGVSWYEGQKEFKVNADSAIMNFYIDIL